MEHLISIAYPLLAGILLGIPFGMRLHRRWYLWIARHDPGNQIQNQNFWNKG